MDRGHEGAWFDRSFELGLGTDALPDILERLRTAPLRLEERLSGIGPDLLVHRRADGWSIQEHAGHLADLEPLWLGRLDDLVAKREALRPADLENRATWLAGHNDRRLDSILAEFGALRAQLVTGVEAMDPDGLGTTALHPRLLQPMTVVDLCFFVAEHDDHHLATISRLKQTTAPEEAT